MNHFMFGVAAYIQENYHVHDDVVVRTVSGSNYVGMSLLSGISVRSIWELWSDRLDDMVRHRPFWGILNMFSMVEHHTIEVLQRINLSSSRRNQHHVRVSILDTLQSVWISEHADKESYISAILSGSFIPFLCGFLWRKHDGKRCIDGGIRLPATTSRKYGNTIRENTLSISIWDNLEFGKLLTVWYVIRGLWSRKSVHHILYNSGYQHAKLRLKSQLDRVMQPTNRTLYSMNTGERKIKWNQKSRIFASD